MFSTFTPFTSKGLSVAWEITFEHEISQGEQKARESSMATPSEHPLKGRDVRRPLLPELRHA